MQTLRPLFSFRFAFRFHSFCSILHSNTTVCVCVHVLFSRLLAGFADNLECFSQIQNTHFIVFVFASLNALYRTAMNTNTFMITNMFTQSLRYGYVLYFAPLLCNRMLYIYDCNCNCIVYASFAALEYLCIPTSKSCHDALRSRIRLQSMLPTLHT